MDIYKLRIKIGNNEFEAEGPKDAVMAQFDAFKELVSRQSAPEEQASTPIERPSMPEPVKNITENLDRLNMLFRNEKNLLSLKIMPAKGKRHISDAVLLVLLGYKYVRNEDEVLGGQLKNALRQSGIIAERIDRKIEGDIKVGLFLKSGQRKGCKYRLTNAGISEAMKLAQGILEQIPQD